jgi:hypothetical protein
MRINTKQKYSVKMYTRYIGLPLQEYSFTYTLNKVEIRKLIMLAEGDPFAEVEIRKLTMLIGDDSFHLSRG